MLKNYYQILDVSPQATKDEIKKAYKLYVFKFHPDKHDNDPFFNARFMEVQEAYEVLSDDELRSEYNSIFFDNNFNEPSEEDEVNYDLEPYVKLLVSNKKIDFGDTVQFQWKTSNISDLTIIGHGNYPVNGNVTFTPTKNTSYIFLFSNNNNTVKKEVLVEVKKNVDIWAIIGVIIGLLLFYFLSN